MPAHFKPDDDEVRELLRNVGAADLITSTADGLLATMLPLIWIEPKAGTDGWGVLHGHVARNNRQWKVPAVGDAMAIIRGPNAYISPAWYATKREHGRVVPTWNYITAHVHGRLVIHDDPAWVEVNVRALSDRHEAAREQPWSVDDAPVPYIEGQLKAIVGVELVDRPRRGQVEAQPEPLRRGHRRHDRGPRGVRRERGLGGDPGARTRRPDLAEDALPSFATRQGRTRMLHPSRSGVEPHFRIATRNAA